jgi:crotonobetainyl-CoA:carnitine CoA-transferase CaiB-like acyl-CoA transferase
MAPHGVYPSTGEDQWVAIACETNAHWAALCDVIGRADLAADTSLATVPGRQAREDELDAILAAWSAELSNEEATERCQAAGIPSHAVQSSAECAADPQLVHRNHFVEVEHAMFDTVTVEGPRAVLSRTPGRPAGGPPTIGQHTYDVVTEILGYDEERLGDLYAMEVLE